MNHNCHYMKLTDVSKMHYVQYLTAGIIRLLNGNSISMSFSGRESYCSKTKGVILITEIQNMVFFLKANITK